MSTEAALFWFEEDSELYRAVDDLDPVTTMPGTWTAFWHRYNSLRDQIEPNERPEHRTGTLLRCTNEIREVLRCLGWHVDDGSQDVKRWTEPWTYEEIVKDCLAPRAFTNLQRLDSLTHTRRVVSRLCGELGRNALPGAAESVDVPHSAKVVRAYPGAQATSASDASQSIVTVCEGIEEEVFDLTLLARADRSVVRVLRAALANFFAVFFSPKVAPRWQLFWNTPQGDNEPLWVWIRFLADAGVGFGRFLRDCLWSYSCRPHLFDVVLGSYFRSRATFAHLAFSRKRNRDRPLVIRIDGEREAGDFDVTDSGERVEISVPKAFVEGPHAYCVEVDLDSFDAAAWVKNSRDRRDALFGPNAGDEQKRLQRSLNAFCRRLDLVLGVSTYRNNARSFVSVVQATKLFPGDAYCFFPVRDAHGNLVSSATIGLRHMPTPEQMIVIRGCIGRLLRVPSLILSPGSRDRGGSSHV
jgi:hypothetical protein